MALPSVKLKLENEGGCLMKLRLSHSHFSSAREAGFPRGGS